MPDRATYPGGTWKGCGSLHNATNNRSLADTSPITAVLAYRVSFQVHLKLLRGCWGRTSFLWQPCLLVTAIPSTWSGFSSPWLFLHATSIAVGTSLFMATWDLDWGFLTQPAPLESDKTNCLHLPNCSPLQALSHFSVLDPEVHRSLFLDGDVWANWH